RSKKKAGRKKKSAKSVAAGSPWDRLAVAAEEMREAAMELAAREAADSRNVLDEFVHATRAKLSDLETVAERGIARLTRK
ncbi:MAG: hypothetical protein RQ847_08310, partial [Wenzhouxiangellaceae bacterium]|nr:hypothetical protein [Wenzhouxiangellaceae bacterium]